MPPDGASDARCPRGSRHGHHRRHLAQRAARAASEPHDATADPDQGHATPNPSPSPSPSPSPTNPSPNPNPNPNPSPHPNPNPNPSPNPNPNPNPSPHPNQVMSLLPGGCTLEQLHQALPFPLAMRDLTAEMHDLRSRQIVQLKPDRSARGPHGTSRLRISARPSRDFVSCDADDADEPPLAELRAQRRARRPSRDFDLGVNEAAPLKGTTPTKPPAARRGTVSSLSELRPSRCEGDAEIAEMRRSRDAAAVPPEVAAVTEEQYEFADIGMREVSHALMADPNPSPGPDRDHNPDPGPDPKPDPDLGPNPNPNPSPNPNPDPNPNPNQVCYALMVDPQKRQIRGCLQAAGLPSFQGGTFEAQEGDNTNVAQPAGSASASPNASFGKVSSFGEISDAEVRRRQPRLSHESSMNVGDLSPSRPRRNAREDVLDSGWGHSKYAGLTAVSSVLATALGRDASTGARRDPSTGARRDPSTKHLRYSRDSGYTSDTSQHGGSSFGRLTSLSSPSPSRTNGRSPSAVGGLVLARALASPSPLRGGSSWMSPNRWGRKEGSCKDDASGDRRAPLGVLQDTRHQHGARSPLGDRPPPLAPATEDRASPAAPGFGGASTAPFRLPCDVASFTSASDPDPSPPCDPSDSTPRHRLICNVPPTPPTPSQTWRFRRAFSLISSGPLAQKLKAVAEKQKVGCRSPWRQVHPQPAAAATGYTTDTTSASGSDSSSSSEMSFPFLEDSSITPTPLRNATLLAPEMCVGGTPVTAAVLPELQFPPWKSREPSPPKLSPLSQPRVARKLVFTDSTHTP